MIQSKDGDRNDLNASKNIARHAVFYLQSPSVAPFLEVRLSTTPEVRLADLMWNPGDNFASLFASCLSDGSVGLWQVMDSVTVTARLPTTVQATCRE